MGFEQAPSGASPEKAKTPAKKKAPTSTAETTTPKNDKNDKNDRTPSELNGKYYGTTLSPDGPRKRTQNILFSNN
jgi:ABC-type uncharacterized transport system involved in gliding motility auxiliary subunit